jgi:hypothetical protein
MRRPKRRQKYEGMGWQIRTTEGTFAVTESQVTIEVDADVLKPFTEGFDEALLALEDFDELYGELEVTLIERVDGFFLRRKIGNEWTPWVFGEDEGIALERFEDEYGDHH